MNAPTLFETLKLQQEVYREGMRALEEEIALDNLNGLLVEIGV